jgi:hypothetical protein
MGAQRNRMTRNSCLVSINVEHRCRMTTGHLVAHFLMALYGIYTKPVGLNVQYIMFWGIDKFL